MIQGNSISPDDLRAGENGRYKKVQHDKRDPLVSGGCYGE